MMARIQNACFVSNVYLKHAILCSCVFTLLACGGEISTQQDQEPDPVVVDVAIAAVKRDLSIEDAEMQRLIAEPAIIIPGSSLI
jgi:hypothetical protein